MQLFYVPEILNGSNAMNAEESRHCVKVLRKSAGDEIYITDGAGSIYLARLINADPKECHFEIKEKLAEPQRRSYYIHIAIAPTKNISRFEWFLEKATEIGIDEITPIICQRSERRKIKQERLEKILIGAMKQSGKARLPVLNKAVEMKKYLKTEMNTTAKYIAYLDEENEELVKLYLMEKNIVILIGPEGDFTKEEVQMAKEKGYKSVSLGSSRLRTETAGIFVCSMMNVLNSME